MPTAVALGNLGLNAGLDALFYPVGAWGIALSTSLCNIAAVLVLLQLLRRKIGRIELTETLGSTVRVLLASGALAVVAHAVWMWLDSALGRSIGAQTVSLLIALAVGTGVYLGVCLLLGVRELRPLRSIGSDDR